VADVLHGNGVAPTLTEALDADLWIDFVADTGDDASVSGAVARLIFERYEVPDPDGVATSLVLPRGHMLVFGGDTAYPVATDLEIHNRVIVPWNGVLRKAHDGKERVLLGIPGNHDWFAGLDGFGRMFRRRRGRIDRASTVGVDEIDRFGQIGHFVHWIEAFRVGRLVVKRAALPLQGYTPVQSASYWALHLAPALDLWGVDRQLRSIDFQQRMYFEEAREDRDAGRILILPDPVHAFLEPNKPGVEILRALDVSLETERVLVFSGDTHHYCREQIGQSTHVTAGGGGAFLHPARINRSGVKAPDAEFPGPGASLSLALRIPWLMALGRSGFLVHAFFAVVYLPTYGLDYLHGAHVSPSAVTAVIAAVVCLLLGGWRRSKAFEIGALAALTGIAIGFLPLAIQALATSLLGGAGAVARSPWLLALEYAVAVYGAVIIGGFFITALTLLGLEHHQAFGALAHPGYKHFARLRIKKDGSLVDAWIIGKADPLSRSDKVVLVDHFRWSNPLAPPPKPPKTS
jgi:hypothetical protein